MDELNPLLCAIEQFALSVAQHEEHKVLMPPQTWTKFRRLLKVAGIDDPTTMALDQVDIDIVDHSFYDEC